MPTAPESIATHWDLLWYLLIILAGAAYVEFRWQFHELMNDIKRYKVDHDACQRELPKLYLMVADYKEDRTLLKEDRDEKWDEWFWAHTHYPKEVGGKVNVSKKEA